MRGADDDAAAGKASASKRARTSAEPDEGDGVNGLGDSDADGADQDDADDAENGPASQVRHVIRTSRP